MRNANGSWAFDASPTAGGIGKLVTGKLVDSWYLTLPVACVVYCLLDLLLLKLAVLKLGRNPQGPFPLGFQPSKVPRFLLGLRVGTTGREAFRNAYQKYKDTSFQIVRNNSQMVVLAPHLLGELTSLPEKVASMSTAISHEFVGTLSGFDQLEKSPLHRLVLQRRLTPRIHLITPSLEKTIAEACRNALPDSEEWAEFEPFHVFGRISASAGGCIVGHGLGNNETWFEIAVGFSQATLGLTFFLRSFPLWMQRWVALVTPDFWRARESFAKAKKLLAPILNERIAASDSGKWEPRDDNPNDADLLSCMAHMAKGAERNGEFLSRSLVLVGFASTHTQSHHMIATLLEIMDADASLREELVEEIRALARAGWSPASYDAMEKMDSVLAESLRIEPPMLTGVRRYFKDAYTFKDGTYVAPGTYVCMATHAIATDESTFPDPDKFDGLRNYRLRRERGERQQKDLLFASATPSGLHWGYGRAACPGRFFASVVLKMVMAKLLIEYECRYMPEEGGRRPPTVTMHDFTSILPTQKMLIRRRKGMSAPF